MVVIKFWAEFQELSGSADGTNRNRKMSNYALNLLVIFFLQNEKFLPSVKELHYNTAGEDSCIINGFECGFPRYVYGVEEYHKKNLNIGQLFYTGCPVLYTVGQ